MSKLIRKESSLIRRNKSILEACKWGGSKQGDLCGRNLDIFRKRKVLEEVQKDTIEG